MSSYLYRMPTGLEGSITRPNSSTIEPIVIGPSPLAYGKAVKVEDGKAVSLAEGDEASQVYGILTRPTVRVSASNGANEAVASPGEVHDILRRGYLTVKLEGKAQKGGRAYLNPENSVFTVSGGDGLIELATSTFMDEADANGLVELAYNI